MTENKVFDRELYRKCDPFGKEKAILFFTKLREIDSRLNFYNIPEEGEQYKAHDLLMREDYSQTDYFVEAEVRLDWWKKVFGGYWQTISVPMRKVGTESNSNFFITMDHTGTEFILFDMELIKKSPIKRKDTKHKKNEPFAEVDKIYGRRFKIVEDKLVDFGPIP